MGAAGAPTLLMRHMLETGLIQTFRINTCLFLQLLNLKPELTSSVTCFLQSPNNGSIS